METMRISQLAESSGVPVTTLRFYEAAGLVPAERSPAGYRLYRPDALARLRFIGAAKQLGLPLAEIGELLELRDNGACAQVKTRLLGRLARRLAETEVRQAETEAFIRELRRASARLEALPDRAERCGPECGLSEEHAVPAPDPALVPGRMIRDATGPDRRGEQPVACSLRPAETQERVARWQAVLAQAGRREVEHGVALSVPSERAGELAALCVAEQDCCPFFDFMLRFEGPTVSLEIRAPRQARELIEALTAGAGAGT